MNDGMNEKDDVLGEILTKEKLLQGIELTETVHIDGLGRVRIRPLSDGELNKVQSMRAKALMEEKTGNNQKDFAHFTEVSYEADCETVAIGLSVGEEHWTAEEVKGIRPPGSVGKIAKAVLDISKPIGGLNFFRAFCERAGLDYDTLFGDALKKKSEGPDEEPDRIYEVDAESADD